jgi:simple sugar transport system permease protein
MNDEKKRPDFIELPVLGELYLSGVRPLIGVFLGLLAGAVIILFYGVNPLVAYKALLVGSFGSVHAVTNVLVRSSPLLIAGVGVAIGIKAKVFNIGAEGYMYMGAIGAAAVAIPQLPVPPIIHILLSFITAMVVASLWGLIPAFLRAYRDVNEVVVTIMFNYVAIYFVSWMVHAPQPMAEPDAFFPMSYKIAETAKLPHLISGTSLHPGFIIGLLACVLFYLILRFTTFGFRTRMLGVNPIASRYAGMKVKRQTLIVLVIGAMMGGMAGAFEILGLKERVYMDFVSGVGYDAVAAALLANGNPLGVIASAMFFSALKAGSSTMSIQTGIGAPVTSIIEALCVIFVMAIGFGERRRLKRKQKFGKEDEEVQHAG